MKSASLNIFCYVEMSLTLTGYLLMSYCGRLGSKVGLLIKSTKFKIKFHDFLFLQFKTNIKEVILFVLCKEKSHVKLCKLLHLAVLIFYSCLLNPLNEKQRKCRILLKSHIVEIILFLLLFLYYMLLNFSIKLSCSLFLYKIRKG